MFVLDSHCDTPSQILRLRDLATDDPHSHVDFPKLSRGKVDGAFFALYIPSSLDDDALAAQGYAMKLIDGVNAAIQANRTVASLTTSVSQALANKDNGLFSVFLGLENGSPIGKSLEKLSDYHSLGVRYVTLCHSGNNLICDSSATPIKKWGGLSPFGREVVAEMNRLGMVIDVSHVSDASFYDVIESSVLPVVATHSCCRALADHPRNMTDDMIKVLADAGGVIQINFYPVFLDAEFSLRLSESGLMERGDIVESEFILDPGNAVKRQAWHDVLDELSAMTRPSYKKIADHIDHVVSLVGIDHVGLGSDFDGIAVTPCGMENVSCFYNIFDELAERGYSASDIAKVAGGNFFRVMERNGC